MPRRTWPAGRRSAVPARWRVARACEPDRRDTSDDTAAKPTAVRSSSSAPRSRCRCGNSSPRNCSAGDAGNFAAIRSERRRAHPPVLSRGLQPAAAAAASPASRKAQNRSARSPTCARGARRAARRGDQHLADDRHAGDAPPAVRSLPCSRAKSIKRRLRGGTSSRTALAAVACRRMRRRRRCVGSGTPGLTSTPASGGRVERRRTAPRRCRA